MKGFLKFPTSLALLPAALLAASCSAMHEDLPECPYGLYVKFVYDYNTMRADMFPDHVGHIQLNVFNEAGDKVAERVISNSESQQPLGKDGFSIYFNNDELPPGHSYRLQTIAMQKDWEEALATRGAKYRLTEGVRAHECQITLDHTTFADTCGHDMVSNLMPLDTLWHTLKVVSTQPLDTRTEPEPTPTRAPFTIYPLEDQMVRIEAEKYTYATVSLIRDTKHLNVTLRQVDNPADVFSDDYEVVIIDDNTRLDGNNELVKGKGVHYTPYESWTTRFNTDGSINKERATRAGAEVDSEGVIQRTAHYDMMFNRVMVPAKQEDGGRLIVRNKKTGKPVAEMSLPDILAEGRTAYEIYNYGKQEYLDREHDYRLDFILKGDTWQSVYIKINVLSWEHRIDNVTLE